MSELIRIEGVSKRYRLGVINRGMLYKDIQSWWARKTGREDPHEVLGGDVTGNRKFQNNGEFLALQDINLSIQQGETVGIIGRNGAGKSTLLKILSRTTSPSKGKVYTRGRIASLLEVGTGFHPELTGRENVYLNGAILGMSRREVKSKFDDIIAFSEIEKFIDTPVKRYSSGMYVRLAFAVAAHLDPEVLIVDEVLAVGDAAFQKKCIEKMTGLTSQGQTVILVSHAMLLIERIANRCVWLDDGRVVLDGESAVVIKDYVEASQKKILNNDLSLSDPQHRRGTGRVRLADLKLFNDKNQLSNNFSRGSNIRFSFQCEVRDVAAGLEVEIGFKIGSSGEMLLVTGRKEITAKTLLKSNACEFELDVDTAGLPASFYDLYIYLGPYGLIGESDQYYDIIDALLRPIRIVESETASSKTKLPAKLIVNSYKK